MIPQKIVRVRRNYNVWVANQTMEDFSLRFTAKSARKWSPYSVANTALGAISFLALEAIGATITYNYGFTNAAAAIIAVGILIFLTSLPISYYAANSEEDIDPKLIKKPFDNYLMKPFLHSDLLTSIQKVLNINWKYQNLNKDIITLGSKKTTKPYEKAIPRDMLDSLMKSVRSGNIRALQTRLDEIKNKNETTYPLIDRLEHELKNFNLENFEIILSENGERNDTN